MAEAIKLRPREEAPGKKGTRPKKAAAAERTGTELEQSGLGEFENAAYESEKCFYDPLNTYIREALHLNPKDFNVEYVGTETGADPETGKETKQEVRSTNYHDILEWKKDLPAEEQAGAVLRVESPAFFERLNNGVQNDAIFKNRDRILSLIREISAGKYFDWYATEVQRGDIETKRTKSRSSEAKEKTRVYENPAEDPAVGAVNKDVLASTRREIGKIEFSPDEWNRAFDPVSRRTWDKFVLENPEKASAYRDKYKVIKEALERLEGKAARPETLVKTAEPESEKADLKEIAREIKGDLAQLELEKIWRINKYPGYFMTVQSWKRDLEKELGMLLDPSVSEEEKQNKFKTKRFREWLDLFKKFLAKEAWAEAEETAAFIPPELEETLPRAAKKTKEPASGTEEHPAEAVEAELTPEEEADIRTEALAKEILYNENKSLAKISDARLRHRVAWQFLFKAGLIANGPGMKAVLAAILRNRFELGLSGEIAQKLNDLYNTDALAEETAGKEAVKIIQKIRNGLGNPPAAETAKTEREAEKAEALAEEAAEAGAEVLKDPAAVGAAVKAAVPNASESEKEKLAKELGGEESRIKLTAKIKEYITGYVAKKGGWNIMLAGFATGLATRTAVKKTLIRYAWGSNILLGAAAGAAAGAIVETGKEIYKESGKIVAADALEKLRAAKSEEDKALIYAKLKKAYEAAKVSGNKEEIKAFGEEFRAVKTVLDARKETAGLVGKDKVLVILKVANGIKEDISADERNYIKDCLKELKIKTESWKSWDWNKIGRAAARGAMTGAFGGAIGGAIAGFIAEHIHIVGGEKAAESAIKKVALVASHEKIQGGAATMATLGPEASGAMEKSFAAAQEAMRKNVDAAAQKILARDFTINVEQGDGLTHVARKGIHDFISNSSKLLGTTNAFSPEKLVYAEDWLQKNITPDLLEKGAVSLHPGETVDIPAERILEALQKADALGLKQIENLAGLIKAAPLSEETLEFMRNEGATLTSPGNNFYEEALSRLTSNEAMEEMRTAAAGAFHKEAATEAAEAGVKKAAAKAVGIGKNDGLKIVAKILGVSLGSAEGFYLLSGLYKKRQAAKAEDVTAPINVEQASKNKTGTAEKQEKENFRVEVRHGLPPKEALERIRGLLAKIKKEHKQELVGLEESWIGNTDNFKLTLKVKIPHTFFSKELVLSGGLTVGSDRVVLNGNIPEWATVFKGAINKYKGVIAKQMEAVLAA